MAVEKSTNDMLVSGKVAMHSSGWWGRFQAEQVAELEEADRFKMWSVCLPKSPSGNRPSAITINCISMAPDISTADRGAAWELMRGLTSRWVNVDFVYKRFGPGRKSALATARDQIDPYMMPSYLALEEVMEARRCSNHRGQEYVNVFSNTLDPLWIGEAEPTDRFLDEATAKVQAFLDKPEL